MGTRPGARLGVERAGRIGLAAGLALLPAPADACAVCVDWGREWQGLNPGFYWSAVLLTVLPFVLVAAAGVWLSRLVWTADRASASVPRPRADSQGLAEPAPDPPLEPAALADTRGKSR
jgi:hypothetical protein